MVFSSSEIVLISPFRRIFLQDIKYLVCSLFLSALWMCHTIAFLPPWFLMRKHLFNLLRLTFMKKAALLLLLSIFFLHLASDSLIIMYLIVNVIVVNTTVFILLEILELLECVDFGLLSNLERVWLLYLQEYFLPFSHFLLELLWYTCYYAWWCPTDLWGSVYFSSFLFFISFPQTGQFKLTFLQVCLLFPQLTQIFCWALLVNFSFELYFSTPEFLFGSI